MIKDCLRCKWRHKHKAICEDKVFWLLQKNKWVNPHCQSCYMRQMNWIYPLKTVWKQNKSLKKKLLWNKARKKIPFLEMTPEYAKDIWKNFEIFENKKRWTTVFIGKSLRDVCCALTKVAFFFFFYLGFLLRSFTTRRKARQGGGYLVNPSQPLSPAS